MLPKKGIVFPNGENLGTYPTSIAYALRNELGTTHQATKIVMGGTGAGERTVASAYALCCLLQCGPHAGSPLRPAWRLAQGLPIDDSLTMHD
jgi:hypothetical protein